MLVDVPTLGSEIRKARKAKNMTLADVELATGVSDWKLKMMEHDGNPRLDDLLAVVAYVGCPLGEVIRHPRRSEPWVAPKPKV